MVTLEQYQEFTKGKARYNEDVHATVAIEDADGPWIHEEPLHYIYPVLALAEEAGEVAGKVAKYVRKSGTDYQELRKQVLPELGDVAYQLSESARQFGYTLDEVLQHNMDKLDGREARGTLLGEGDVR